MRERTDQRIHDVEEAHEEALLDAVYRDWPEIDARIHDVEAARTAARHEALWRGLADIARAAGEVRRG